MLWIGEEGAPTITPTVRFDCESNKQHGLLIGDGNKLRICSATITAATQDWKHMAGCKIEPHDVRIADSRLSWIAGNPGMTYGFSSIGRPIRRVTFEHGPAGLYNAPQWAEDCVFRDLEIAVRDGVALNATLVRCRFEGNRRNWALMGSQFGIMAIDCEFGEEKDPGPHIMRWRNPQGQWQYPSFVAMRHIVIKVEDQAGKPIEGALVEVAESSGDLSAVHHGAAKTDAEGKTPAPFEYGALLLTDYAYKATDDVPEPDSRECRIASYDYRYDVRVTAEGYQEGIIEDLDPDEAWVERAVTLRRAP